MKPDNDDPAGQDEDENQVPVPRVPKSPDLPPPPDIQFTRPDFAKRERAEPERIVVSESRVGSNMPESTGEVGRIGAGMAAGVMFAASVVAGVMIGSWIDHRWPHVTPWGTLVFALIGVAAGFLNLFRLLTVYDRSKKPK
jgi:F0F1-type ATP synthase assembly protein I